MKHSSDASPEFIKTNIANRLHRIFSSVALVNPDQAWRAFARPLSISVEDEKLGPLLVSSSLKQLLSEIERLEVKLNDLPRLTSETRERPIRELRQIVLYVGGQPNSSWQSFHGNLRRDLLQTLLMWGQILENDEVELPTNELREAQTAIREARTAIEGDRSLSESVRRTMLHLLDLLDEALNSYAIGGVEAVKERLRSFFVAWHAASGPMNEQSSSGLRAFSDAIRKAGPFIRTIVTLDALYQASEHTKALVKPFMLLLSHEIGGS